MAPAAGNTSVRAHAAHCTSPHVHGDESCNNISYKEGTCELPDGNIMEAAASTIDREMNTASENSDENETHKLTDGIIILHFCTGVVECVDYSKSVSTAIAYFCQ